MGIFGRIRERKDPNLLKKLNRYLNFGTRLAEKDVSIRFFEDCIRRNVYPRLFYKQIRRSRIRPDSVTLKRHTCNCLDTLRSEATELKRLLIQQQPLETELPVHDYRDFMDYVDTIVKKRVAKKTASLERSLYEEQASSPFQTIRIGMFITCRLLFSMTRYWRFCHWVQISAVHMVA